MSGFRSYEYRLNKKGGVVAQLVEFRPQDESQGRFLFYNPWVYVSVPLVVRLEIIFGVSSVPDTIGYVDETMNLFFSLYDEDLLVI